MSVLRASGAVVVRSRDDELQLQGLRTALSLALGDRPAALFLVGDGAGVLGAPRGSEAQECIAALAQAGIALVVEAGALREAPPGVEVIERPELLGRIAKADFQQTF